MAMKITIDAALLDKVFQLSGEPTREAAATRALTEFIVRREQRKINELFGKLEWNAYDYKVERGRRI